MFLNWNKQDTNMNKPTATITQTKNKREKRKQQFFLASVFTSIGLYQHLM